MIYAVRISRTLSCQTIFRKTARIINKRNIYLLQNFVFTFTTTNLTHIGRRHNGGINAAWLDGHVDFRKSSQMVGVVSSKWGDTVCAYYFAMYPAD